MCRPDSRPTRVWVWCGCGLLVLVFGVTAVLARGSGPSTVELDVFGWFDRLPGGLARPLWLVMQLGAVVGGLVVGIGFMAWRRGSRGALEAATAVLVAWLAAKVVKVVVDRGRPADYLDTVNTRFEPVLRGGGYVSGHTTVAFALAVVIAGSLRGWWRVVPYALALLVGVARLYFGAHLPLDVVGGAALGILIGLVVRQAFGSSSVDREIPDVAP